MYDYTVYDERAAYDRRRHRRGSSSASKSSVMSRSSSSSSTVTYCSDATYEETKPPPYVNLFYNTFEDKPLPAEPKRRVRFALDKPLPPVSRPMREDEPIRRKLLRSSSRDGEYAWWAHRQEMDDREYDRIASARRH